MKRQYTEVVDVMKETLNEHGTEGFLKATVEAARALYVEDTSIGWDEWANEIEALRVSPTTTRPPREPGGGEGDTGMTTETKEQAEVTRTGLLDMQVCVPEDWDDEAVETFANNRVICGTKNGWMIRSEGDKYLAGDHERTPCSSRLGFVHIMLDA